MAVPDANATASVEDGDPADWPDELDAPVAAPDNHRVLFENDRVRVLEVTLGPHQAETPHHHRWPSVLCVLQAEHLVDHAAATGAVVLDTRGGPGPLPPLATIWKDPEPLHYVENPSDEPIQLLRIELKP